MSKLKNNWILLGLHLGFVSLLFLFSVQPMELIHFINLLFYVNAFYLILLLTLFIINGRFLDGLAFGLRRARYMLSKKKDYLSEDEKKPLPSEKVNKSFYRFVRFQAIGLLIPLLLLMLVYYI